MKPDTEIITEAQPAALNPAQPVKTANKRLLFIFISAIIGLLMLGGGLAFLLMSMTVNQTDRFYQALEKSMSTKYLNQKYDVSSTSSLLSFSITADTYSDFSDVKAPKTKAHLVIDSNSKTVEDADFVITKNYTNYAKIKVLGDGQEYAKSNYKKDVWYSFSSKSQASFVDIFNMGGSVNQTFGEFLSGNYTEADRNALVKLYKDEKCFTFDSKTDVKERTIDGEKLYVYTVKMNGAAILKVNQEAAKRLGIAEPDRDQYKDGTVEISVRASDNRVVHVTMTENQLKMNVTISYPSSVDIVVPTDAKPLTGDTVINPTQQNVY